MNCEQSTELLSDRLKGLLSPEDEQALEAHLAECLECRRVATEAALLLGEEARRRKWVVAAPAAALAAAAALALFVILPAGEHGPPVRDTMRSGSDRGLESLPAVEITLPVAENSVQPDSVRFVWRRAAPEALYRLAVTDSAGGRVWETTTSDTTAGIPSDLGLEAGRRYFWYVDALLPDGSEASSGVEEFRTRAR